MAELVLIIRQLRSLISRLFVSSFHDTKNFNGCTEKQKTATCSVRMPTVSVLQVCTFGNALHASERFWYQGRT
jgi:hypothetical protein